MYQEIEVNAETREGLEKLADVVSPEVPAVAGEGVAAPAAPPAEPAAEVAPPTVAVVEEAPLPPNPDLCAIKLSDDSHMLVTWQDTGTYKGWLPAVPLKYVDATLEYTGSKMPLSLWRTVQAFFRWAYRKHHAEAQVRIFRKEETGDWRVLVLKQEVSGASTKEVETDDDRKAKVNALTAEGFHPIGTIHSHGSMSAFQSSTDLNDEQKQPGVHITMGGMNNPEMSLHGRVSLRGLLYEIVWDQWFDATEEVLRTNPPATLTFPPEWKPLVTKWVYVAPKSTSYYAGGYSGGAYGTWENGVFKWNKDTAGCDRDYDYDYDTGYGSFKPSVMAGGATHKSGDDKEPTADAVLSTFSADEQLNIKFILESILEHMYDVPMSEIKSEAELANMCDTMMRTMMTLRSVLRDIESLDNSWTDSKQSVTSLISYLCDTARHPKDWSDYQEAIRLIWGKTPYELRAVVRSLAGGTKEQLDKEFGSDIQPCPACHGSGMNTDGATMCETCVGEGEVHRDDLTDDDDEDDARLKLKVV